MNIVEAFILGMCVVILIMNTIGIVIALVKVRKVEKSIFDTDQFIQSLKDKLHARIDEVETSAARSVVDLVSKLRGDTDSRFDKLESKIVFKNIYKDK